MPWLTGAPPHFLGTKNTVKLHQIGCPVGQCSDASYPLQWRQGVIETLEGHVADLEPDVLVLNTGFHDRLPGGMEIPRIAAAGNYAVSKRNGRVFFRTTTAKRDGDDVNDEEFAQQMEAYGWNILDAATFTADLPKIQRQQQNLFGNFLYWDNLHFLPQGKFR